MKNSKSIIITFILFLHCASTVKNSDTTDQNYIPKGIRYKTCDSTTNANAFNKLNSALAGSNTAEKWFDKGVGCMPFLWKQISSNPYFLDTDGAEMTIMVPLAGGVQQFKGKSFRQPADLDSLQSYIVQTIKADGPFTIRKPNPEELKIYWAFISFDIEEPIFIIESKSHKFIVNFYNDYIFQLDDYYGVGFRK